MKDDLGNRMKEQYENRTRYFIPRRTFTIIRLDGKAFHTFTKGLDKPFDQDLIELMDSTMGFLCSEIQGAIFGYCQSDEISILLYDFEEEKTQAWFDGNIQKIVSVSSSMATNAFTNLMFHKVGEGKEKFLQNGDLKSIAFDSRVFTISDRIEVMNYFIWRQKDAIRNSISMMAQALYSHRELDGKSQADMKEMIAQKYENWNQLPIGRQRGRGIFKKVIKDTTNVRGKITPIFKKVWEYDEEIPVFEVKKGEYLDKIIPVINNI